MTTANTIANQTKIAIAVEVLKIDETGKTKAQIAKEFNVSPRSVSRYAETFENEALDLMTDDSSENLEAAFEETKTQIDEVVTEITDENNSEEDITTKPSIKEEEEKKNKAIQKIKEEKAAKPTVSDTPKSTGRGRGRKPTGVKSIKEIVLETMNEYKSVGKMTKENREVIVSLIMERTDLTEKEAKKYFAGYKKQVGDYDV